MCSGFFFPYLLQHSLPAYTPALSCRTGLSVCMVAATVDGPVPRPYKLQVKPRRLDKGGETINIVSLDKSTMEQVGS